MFLHLTLAGAVGAGVLYAVDTQPALGARAKNAAGGLGAVLIGLLLWQSGIAAPWMLPVAWLSVFALLRISNLELAAIDLKWVRAATAVVLVLLIAHMFK
jgi:hypothetical protein